MNFCVNTLSKDTHTLLIDPAHPPTASNEPLELRVLIDGMEWSLPSGPPLNYVYQKDAAG